jgi:adenosylcobinamide-GDP ribazoletransferase
MTSFLLSLQFLTIIPVRIRHFDERKMARSAVFFPVVGCILGIFLSLIYETCLRCGFSPLASSTVCVVVLIILTGGIHLDGLADTLDAVGSSKDRQTMLAIMREPTIGALGVVGLICVIVSKIVFLSEIPLDFVPAALIFMTTFSRWSQVLIITFFPYVRNEGKASVFAKGRSPRLCAAATIFTILAAIILWPVPGVIVFCLAGCFSYVCAAIINHIIHGYTGDTLGAVTETTETFILLCILIMKGVFS